MRDTNRKRFKLVKWIHLLDKFYFDQINFISWNVLMKINLPTFFLNQLISQLSNEYRNRKSKPNLGLQRYRVVRTVILYFCEFLVIDNIDWRVRVTWNMIIFWTQYFGQISGIATNFHKTIRKLQKVGKLKSVEAWSATYDCSQWGLSNLKISPTFLAI